jgi:hypothetical protein
VNPNDDLAVIRVIGTTRNIQSEISRNSPDRRIMIADGSMSSEYAGGSVSNMLRYQDKEWKTAVFYTRG